MQRLAPRASIPELRSRSRAAALTLMLALMGPAAGTSAQTQDDWNDPRTLELVERARERRRQPVVDASLQNYRAEVAGHIYFFIDREQNPEPVLLRADQVALELYWAQPGRVKQVIRGMRSEEQFPIKDFRYYLDRYTVIHNGFDDVIRVGEGRDIRNVIHPLSGPGRNFYDFRLADSATIRLPAEPEPIRVYEVKVRPRNFDVPGIVGSLFLERARGDLVRLAFTFTPDSYIDPRNERVEVALENGLWEGRYWLPRGQRLLVRRELPQLDLDVGTVIRAALTVERYTFNENLPPGFFGGREVVLAAGPEALADYEFDEGLFDGLDDVGLAPGTDPGSLEAVDVEAIAGSILRQRYLRGVSRFRAYASSGSDIVRYDRAQGLVLGVGASGGIGAGEVYGHAGYAWGPGRPVATLGWQPAGRPRGVAGFGRAYLNDPVDLGLRPAAAGVIATLSAVALGRDLRDVAPSTGLELGLILGDGRAGRLEGSLVLERRSGLEQYVRHAPFDEGLTFRSVPPLEEVGRAVLQLRYGRRGTLGPFATRWEPRLEAGTVFRWTDPGSGPPRVVGPWTAVSRQTGAFARGHIHGTATWSDARRRTGVAISATAGLNVGATPHQHLWYLGGRNTLPGHPLHAYVGDRAAVVDATLWRTLVPRLVRLRVFAGAGWAELDTDPPTPTDPSLRAWEPAPTDGVRSSVGVGLGLVDGILRLDYGLRTDTWDGVLFLSVEPSLWSFL